MSEVIKHVIGSMEVAQQQMVRELMLWIYKAVAKYGDNSLFSIIRQMRY